MSPENARSQDSRHFNDETEIRYAKKQVPFRSTPEIATTPVTIEVTLLSEGNDAFSVELTPFGDVLQGVGRHVGPPQAIDDFVAEAVYLVSFGKPVPPAQI